MIINEPVTGILAILIGYLLGSINSAYIITRLIKGEDIRKLGGGNAGGRNVFRSVGFWAAVPVIIWDLGKGAGSVAIACWLLDVPLYEVNIYVLLAGVAAIAGHMWSVYLKFTGGNGLAAAIGALAMIIPWSLLIVFGIMGALSLLTKNPVLSLNIALLSLPVSSWLFEKEWLLVFFSITIILMMILNFVPTAQAALTDAGGMKHLVLQVLRKTDQ
ncbi:MAG: glycerol-3-phosphate acyltransferase [Dehalococcoidales bacterium]|nr:MAG: glycerol-3-phosphate acyltransferase [Dehalococcoidales bacterium]